jgi:hypothetical protein
MSLEAVQYRSVIRFLVLKGMDREEVISELRGVYQEECPSKRNISLVQ